MEVRVKPAEAAQRIQQADSLDPKQLLTVYAQQLRKPEAAVAVVGGILEVRWHGHAAAEGRWA